jgi:hypothetical protein
VRVALYSIRITYLNIVSKQYPFQSKDLLIVNNVDQFEKMNPEMDGQKE